MLQCHQVLGVYSRVPEVTFEYMHLFASRPYANTSEQRSGYKSGEIPYVISLSNNIHSELQSTFNI
jgi:hypothetical protein